MTLTINKMDGHKQNIDTAHCEGLSRRLRNAVLAQMEHLMNMAATRWSTSFIKVSGRMHSDVRGPAFKFTVVISTTVKNQNSVEL